MLRLRRIILVLLFLGSVILVFKNEQAYRQFELSFLDSPETPDWFTPVPIDKSLWGKQETTEIFKMNAEEDDIRLPNAIGVGAKKCGTIAFAYFLSLNPDFRRTIYTEGHWLYKDSQWKGGFESYKRKLPTSESGQISYEGTPRYLVEANVPARAKAISEDMKIVVTLCDPIKRLRSDFIHTTLTTEPHAQEIKRFANISSFVDAWLPKVKNNIIENGEEYLTDIYYHDITASIITNSIYSHYLNHWLKFFPREQILFLDGEETLKEPYKTMEKAQDFLNIDNVLRKEHFFVNEETGYYCAKRPENMKKTFCLPKSKGRTGNLADPSYLELREDQVKALEEFFRPFNRQLCDIVGHSMSFYTDYC